MFPLRLIGCLLKGYRSVRLATQGKPLGRPFLVFITDPMPVQLDAATITDREDAHRALCLSA